jgi:hypothetical protein
MFLTKLVEQAVAAISQLPPETQDDLARLMLTLAEGAPRPLTPDEAAAIAEAEAEIARGERVPPDTIKRSGARPSRCRVGKGA